LESFPGAGLAVFLAFSGSRIAGEETLGLQRGAITGINGKQSSRNAVPDGAGLTGRTTAHDANADVKFCGRFRGCKWLARLRAIRLEWKIMLESAPVDGDGA
jgi:hypothetical protein